jgi:hypothetical protein
MSRAEQATRFCSALFGGHDGDDRLSGLYATVWELSSKRTQWRRADQPGAVASLIAELDEREGTTAVYVGTGLSDRVGEDKTRPRADEIAGITGLWLDIDILGPGHAGEHYPATVESALRIVDAMRLPPTMVVHSGGGLQVWWLLREPWLTRDAADPDAERARMAALVAEWNATARFHAETLGRWKVDSVFDLARLMRPAGTTNRKISDNPRRVEILRLDEDARYDPDDFDEYLPDASVLAAYSTPVLGQTSATLSEVEREMVKAVNFAAVWARVTSPTYKAADYTPPWLAEILALAAEADDVGKKLIATWQGQRPDLKDDQNRYDAALTRLLGEFDGVDTEALIEAVMCRRLRTAGANTDKVDPRRRLDYITRTVAKFQATAAHAAAVRDQADQRITGAAGLTLAVPAQVRPEPVMAIANGHGDPAEAEAVFAAFTAELIEDVQPAEVKAAIAAEQVVVADAIGVAPPPTPVAPDADPGNPFEAFPERTSLEAANLDILTDLLIDKAYIQRGVRVWRFEGRDYGSNQLVRLLLRMPIDMEWPTDRPSRYRPGRLLPTEWWRRDMFDSPGGFIKAIQRDIMIIAREDGPKEDWKQCIRTLGTVIRRDSSEGDLAHFAHEWLFSYLMDIHGTGEPNEVGSLGKPWIRETNNWLPATPPDIYINKKVFLAYCRSQAGAVIGRNSVDIIDLLRLNPERIRISTPGMSSRRTWYKVDAGQFSKAEWAAIIEMIRPSYERTIGKRGLHAVDDPAKGGVSLGADRTVG